MIRALLDTNVLASGFVGYEVATSVPGQILHLWVQNRFILVLSHHIRSELSRTLENSYFSSRVSQDRRRTIEQILVQRAEETSETIPVIGIASHVEDDAILSAALSADVDVLVTGDRKLLELVSIAEIPIVTPGAFLAGLLADGLPPDPSGTGSTAY